MKSVEQFMMSLFRNNLTKEMKEIQNSLMKEINEDTDKWKYISY